MKNIIIVESPAKAGTIKKFLPKGTKVVASKGHVRDLPKSRLAVDIENDFEPEYINVRGKGDLIKELKKEAKGYNVLLATDPDREGEAISWHLAHILGLSTEEKNRVTFNEITKEKVVEAVGNPRKLDMDLIDAQQARRVLDRIVGFKISPFLWAKVRGGLSAGRVQSATLKLIVDREMEILNFIPEEYWNINVKLINGKEIINATFYGKDKKIELKSKEQVDEILKNIKGEKALVKEIKLGTRKKSPAPPFTTSTLQQDASRKINFSTKKTMAVAQKLYEGITIPKKGKTGLITYMRTDSTRISEQARALAKNVIEAKFGSKYYENRYYRKAKDSQDAHEAIRPTYPDIAPEDIKEYLDKDQFKLYSLIYNRFLASQMANADYDTISVKYDISDYEFRSSGSTIKFDGFLKVYNIEEEEVKGDFEKFPDIKQGDMLSQKEIEPVQSFTKPPARYTEASLVKVLEENGIGRPSTYAPTINTIIVRRYVKKEKKNLIPTDLGILVNNILVEAFSEIVDAKFTAEVEKELDEVAEGKKTWKSVLRSFYTSFEKDLKKAEQEIEKIEKVVELSDEKCHNCGKPMEYKVGRFGKFLACTGYPECKTTKAIVKTIKEKCPICGGQVIVKKTKKGHRTFYICENNNYEKEDKDAKDVKKEVKEGNKIHCDYISWTKPEAKDKK